MPVRTSVAELRIPDSRARICGTVRAFTPVGAMIALQGGAAAIEGLVPGAVVEAALLTADGLHSGRAVIVRREGKVVVVSLRPPPVLTERRRMRRRQCRLPVQCRMLRSETQRGAWADGLALDVSAEGMRIETVMDCGGLPRLELRFDLCEGVARQVRAYGDDGVTVVGDEVGHFMRVQARAVWCRRTAQGWMAGLHFRSPSPCCRMRLARYAAGENEDLRA